MVGATRYEAAQMNKNTEEHAECVTDENHQIVDNSVTESNEKMFPHDGII